MFCPRCGKQIPDNAKFCVHCGNPIGDDAGPGANPPKRKKGLWGVIFTIVIIVLLVALAVELLVAADRFGLFSVPLVDKLLGGSGASGPDVTNEPNVTVEEVRPTEKAPPAGDMSEVVDEYSEKYPNVKLKKGSIPSKIVTVDDPQFSDSEKPYVVFSSDMTCSFHASTSLGTTDLPGTYEVYLYDGGKRTISAFFEIDDFVRPEGDYLRVTPRVFFKELSGNDWEFCGESLGYTLDGAHFRGEDSSVSVKQCVVNDGKYSEYVGYWEASYSEEIGQDYDPTGITQELALTEIVDGTVSMNMWVYRAFGFEFESGIIAPDGNVYAFLPHDSDAPSLATVSFGDNSVSISFQSPERKWGTDYGSPMQGSFTFRHKSNVSEIGGY